MGSRLELQSKLEELLESDHVYFEPPESKEIKYPAIIYSCTMIDEEYANNRKYIKNKRYELIVVDRRPDNPVIEKILELPYSSYDRMYKSDNLYHDVVSLYY